MCLASGTHVLHNIVTGHNTKSHNASLMWVDLGQWAALDCTGSAYSAISHGLRAHDGPLPRQADASIYTSTCTCVRLTETTYGSARRLGNHGASSPALMLVGLAPPPPPPDTHYFTGLYASFG